MKRARWFGVSVLCALLVLVSSSLAPAQGGPGGPGGNRKIHGIATRPGTAPGSESVHVLWSAAVGSFTSTTDMTTTLELRVNGTTVSMTTETAIALGTTPCQLPVGGCNTGTCGSWMTASTVVDGFCRETTSPTGPGCECAAQFITALPPTPLAPGDEIMIILYPASGATPDSDTTDDTWIQIFNSTIAGPNRTLDGVSLQANGTGGGSVEINYVIESGPSSTALDLSTEIEVLLNGTVISSTTHTLSKDPEIGSCDNNACLNQLSCAVYVTPASPPIGGACLGSKTQLTCACSIAFSMNVPTSPLAPGDEIMVLLRPAPGAWPDLPGLPDDHTHIVARNGNRRVATFASQPGATAGTEDVCLIWEITSEASTMPQDFSTEVEVLVNGSVVATALQIAISQLAGDCSLGGACSQAVCGSWSDGVTIDDGFCRNVSSGAIPECRCGVWWTTEIPGVPMQPGDEIMVLLRPAPGALPDSDTGDDRYVQAYSGSFAGPNRRFGAITDILPSPTTPSSFDVFFEVDVETGSSQFPLDLRTEVELRVNGLLVASQLLDITKEPDVGSCENNACLNMDGCGIYQYPVNVPLAGQCLFSPTQMNCVCTLALSLDFQNVPIDPGGVVEVTLRPVPGALPELPPFEEDDEGGPDPTAPNFQRGDCNTDGNFDIGDPVTLLGELFGGQPEGICADACDINDDGAKNIADAVYALNALFNGGAAPPEPHPACGVDPTNDNLDCSSFPPCHP